MLGEKSFSFLRKNRLERLRHRLRSKSVVKVCPGLFEVCSTEFPAP